RAWRTEVGADPADRWLVVAPAPAPTGGWTRRGVAAALADEQDDAAAADRVATRVGLGHGALRAFGRNLLRRHVDREPGAPDRGLRRLDRLAVHVGDAGALAEH